MQAKKFELPPPVACTPHQNIESPRPSPDHSPHIGKKVSLIAFRQILPKILPAVCIFSHTVMIYVKKYNGTKSLNTKQYPAGLSPRIIPHYPSKLL